jgi:hypothetical protein
MCNERQLKTGLDRIIDCDAHNFCRPLLFHSPIAAAYVDFACW